MIELTLERNIESASLQAILSRNCRIPVPLQSSLIKALNFEYRLRLDECEKDELSEGQLGLLCFVGSCLILSFTDGLTQ